MPASQRLGDVTHTGIGCSFGSAPQNDNLLYAPFGSDHNSSAFSPETPEQRGRCLGDPSDRLTEHKSQFSHLNPYILYHLAVKHEHLMGTAAASSGDTFSRLIDKMNPQLFKQKCQIELPRLVD